MLPLSHRRRARRRSRSGRFVLLIAALIVVAVVIGGLTMVSRQSGPFDTSQNRSFASAGGVVADQSNVTGSDLRHLIKGLPTAGRLQLEGGLDTIVQRSAQQSTQAAAVVGAPSGGIRAQFVSVFADRATAALRVREALDGLLGLHPLPVAGAPQASGASTRAPTLLSTSEATSRMVAAGALLERADQTYRSVRRALARAAGHARLPASEWVTSQPAWQFDAVATQVEDASTSSTLATTHQVQIRTVRISPPALPSSTGVTTPGSSTLSPTHRFQVSVVISNLGSVDEPHVTVQFTLTSLAASLTSTVNRSSAVTAGRSVALNQVVFAVKPGQGYRLTVAIVPPAGQSDLTNTSVTQVLQIAPGT